MRVGRSIFNIIAIFSLLLCLATLYLWGRSYFYLDHAAYEGAQAVDGRQSEFAAESYVGIGSLTYDVHHYSADGATVLSAQPSGFFTSPPFRLTPENRQSLYNGHHLYRLADFSAGVIHGGEGVRDIMPNSTRYQAHFPLWALALLLALMPIIAIGSSRRRKTAAEPVAPPESGAPSAV